MPSSTSSFKTYRLERIIPNHHWALLALVVFSLTLILTLGWEIYCRSIGYAPTLNDTEDLWVSRRAILEENPKRTVLIGSSRMLFDFNLDVYEKNFNERPLQLSTVGSNPAPYLKDLADDLNYSGTVIVGFVPKFFFTPLASSNNANRHLRRYREWTPAQKIGNYLGMFLERRFAFIQKEDLSLKQLLIKLKVPDRPEAKVPPELPPYFHEVDEERQGGMTDFAEKNSAIQKRIQKIWMPLFTPPPQPQLTELEIKEKSEKVIQAVLETTKTNVEKIRAKGGKVIFVRLPSSGELRELEEKTTPREKYWDRLIESTQSPGIHFEDYLELRNFDCPEWSHLTKEDAIRFTKRLMVHFKKLKNKGKF